MIKFVGYYEYHTNNQSILTEQSLVTFFATEDTETHGSLLSFFPRLLCFPWLMFKMIKLVGFFDKVQRLFDSSGCLSEILA